MESKQVLIERELKRRAGQQAAEEAEREAMAQRRAQEQADQRQKQADQRKKWRLKKQRQRQEMQTNPEREKTLQAHQLRCSAPRRLKEEFGALKAKVEKRKQTDSRMRKQLASVTQ